MLYSIKNDKLYVEIALKGAELKKITYLGENQLHDSNPTYWNRSAPLLFPIVGKLLDGKCLIKGQEYLMNGHGFLRDSEFELLSQNETSIELIFKSNQETLKLYPYHFSVIVSYNVIDDQLNSEIKVVNESNEVMPFNLGLHPAFITNKFEDCKLIFPKPITSKIGNVNLTNGTIDFLKTTKRFDNVSELPLNYEDYAEDAIVLDNIEFDNVTLLNTKTNHGVKFTFNNFTMLGIWTPYPKNAPFLCIEPWRGCADTTENDGNFENKRHLVKLLEKESYSFTYSFKFF